MVPLQEAQRQIASGEKLVWAERASPGKLALRRLPIALFGIPFFGFAVFWVTMASKATADVDGPFQFFPLFGMIFVIVGAGMLLSPLWGYAIGMSTTYAITDRRLMILRKFPRQTVESYDPKDIGRIVRHEGAGGRGDVIFREEERYGSRGRVRIQKIGFFGIPEVRRVEEAVRKLKDSADDRDRR